MKAIRKPIEEEFVILRPNVDSIKECYLFLSNQEKKEIDVDILNTLINNCLKDYGLKHRGSIICFNSAIVKNDVTITSFPIEYFKKTYDIVNKDIDEKYRKMNSLSSDIGFMGSPEYSKLQKEVEEHNKYIEQFLK